MWQLHSETNIREMYQLSMPKKISYGSNNDNEKSVVYIVSIYDCDYFLAHILQIIISIKRAEII